MRPFDARSRSGWGPGPSPGLREVADCLKIAVKFYADCRVFISRPMVPEIGEETPLLGKKHETTRQLSRTTAVFVVLLLGELLSHAETTLMFTTSALIASEFAHLEAAGWLVTAYTLGVCAAQPLYGQCSDLFGRKAVLLCAYGLAAAGCVVCGAGPGLWTVVAGRAVSGLGGAGLMIISSIIITDAAPKNRIAQYRAYVNMASTLGRGLGGPLGGYVLDRAHWRWLFFGRVPLLGLLAVLMAALFDERTFMGGAALRRPPALGRDGTWGQRLGEIDYVGAGLLCASITAANLLINGQTGGPLPRALLLASLGLALPAFAYFELYGARKPLIDLRILVRRNVAVSYAIVLLQVMAQVTMMFSVPVYFQVTRNASASRSGLCLVPAIAGNAAGALLTGRYIRKTRRFRPVLFAAGPMACLSYVLVLLWWNGGSGEAAWEALCTVPGGAATGMATSAAFVSMTAFLRPKHMATATGIFFLVNSMGSSLGVSVGNLVTQSLFGKYLRARLRGEDSLEVIRRVTSDIRTIADIPDGIRATIVEAFVDALKGTFVLGFIVSLLPFLLAAMVEDADL
ncbi:multidrug resistance [Cordyceps militaris]|uniref:Multidrug resistance n=1 Tax=Cordyceps militaris TaxID=73501 RepID=A0A2H4SI66_CORMI|nr:multidrug resistance [Cordyceps militaris]